MHYKVKEVEVPTYELLFSVTTVSLRVSKFGCIEKPKYTFWCNYCNASSGIKLFLRHVTSSEEVIVISAYTTNVLIESTHSIFNVKRKKDSKFLCL